MIVAFSTSSPLTSVAVLSSSGEVVFSASSPGGHNASGVALGLLASFGVDLASVSVFAADVGPGSFIGSRVGVTLAKTMAYARGALVMGATSFDLISPTMTVAFPSRKGEWFVRLPGEEPYRMTDQSSHRMFVPVDASEDLEGGASGTNIRWLHRDTPQGLEAVEVVGFGPGFVTETFPLAEKFGLLLTTDGSEGLGSLKMVKPEELVPAYLIEPSISQPKRETVVRPGE